MKQLKQILLIALGTAVSILAILPLLRNPEKKQLNNEERKKASGKFIQLRHGWVHYQLEGPETGQVVVLVHGFSTPYYVWDPTFAALTQAGFRVLRYDLYGRGYSDRPKVAYDGSTYVNQLQALLNELELKQPIHLIGLSMGGAILIDFADTYPEDVKSLTLVDPLVRGIKIPLLDKPLLGEYLMPVYVAPTMANGQYDDFYEPERFPNWAEPYKVQMEYKGYQRAILATIRNYLSKDHEATYQRVGQLDLPMLLVWGREDQTIPFAQSVDVLTHLNARFLPVDAAGHLPHYEQPEVVNPVIINFLQTHV